MKKRKGLMTSLEKNYSVFNDKAQTLSFEIIRDFEEHLIYGSPGKYYYRYVGSVLTEVLDEYENSFKVEEQYTK